MEHAIRRAVAIVLCVLLAAPAFAFEQTPTAIQNVWAAPVTFTYFANGLRQTMADVSGTTTYGYDTRNRLTSKITPEGTLNYTYDSAGDLLTLKSSNTNGASDAYTYDTLNRLSTVTDSSGGGWHSL